ncbi:MAG TPA: chemotaxis-specific protein-glutamate methyltransferase CheB [Planctomycetota bacterium]|nr:chemotaxis-specific protein-glutamate methyltransferase CheB [Planctomycetota bacterium]
MANARVLVVDDSVVCRRLVASILDEAEGVEVVGTAPNGRIALDKVRQLAPDVVVLDIEMPEMDGLTALAELRRGHPAVKVVMFSVLTERGAAATLDALSLGAADYATKPAATADHADAVRAVREQLVPKVLALVARAPAASLLPPPAPPAPAAEPAVLAIAASTGGPDALPELLLALPREFPVPVLVVQHMPPVFTRLFARRLDGRVPLPVAEATDGQELANGRVYLAPGDYHLEVHRGHTVLHRAPPVHSCRPAADVLFRTVAEEYGPAAVAVVLSGMGRDGCAGASEIRRSGGRVFAQDPQSCAVFGMPRHVIEAGLAELVAPPARLGAEIARLVLAGARR